jgi:hypothetical protein
VFLVNSRYPLFCYTFYQLPNKGTPSPEVTESFCRIPSILLSHRFNILYQNISADLGTVFFQFFPEEHLEP